MLSPQSWLPLADNLPIGRSIRVDHDCGGGRTLKISHDETGLHAYCFRCSDPGRAPRPVESLADKLARFAAARQADQLLQVVRGRPEPAVYDVDSWPAHARLWFYRAGLSRADIGKLGAYWHAPTARVVLQFGRGFWLARTLDTRQPKYLSGDRPPDMIVRWGGAPSPTLCEDALSAYKVGRVGEGWAILGTSVSSAYIAELMRRATRVNVWLDPDAAGQRAARRYVKQLRAYGLEVRNIVSRKDPKLHTLNEILEYTS